MNKDLTIGKPETVLWRFCLPLFGSIIFQQLYNIADSLVAGKFIGENALAAVGNSYEITLIFIAFAFGCNMGCSIIVSQLFGAKDYTKLKTAVSTACIFSAVICALLMLAAAAPDPDTGKCLRGFQPVSGHLCMGASLCILLQYCHRNFLRIGRFENPFLLSGHILHIQYRRRYPVREEFSHGCGRRSVGYFSLPGDKLYFSRHHSLVAVEKNPGSGKSTPF